MSRNNLEYGAIIDADDDNDGDLVLPLSALSLAMHTDSFVGANRPRIPWHDKPPQIG